MIFKNGIINTIYLSFCWLLTKILYNEQKIIRFPFEVRGKKNISFSENLSTGRYCRIEAYSTNHEKVLKIGHNCQINDNVHIVACENVTIKDNVLIASRVFVSDLNHGSYSGCYQSHPSELAAKRVLSSSPVIIESNVWLGEGVVVLPGVTIGENVIVGANSVVSKSLESNSIYAGNPAKLIKKYNFETESWERV
ncbi:putative lipopolysaccharide biosynthesis O-acetyl transferase WbbJ [Vibrio chagasii]|uniref:DapH/DapD/GlmU-related protein n=1 Tax=Vibrio TaxID=662 RepID=UPI000CF4F97A|nr:MULTISPECIES: DapH/DapD/GlmU-related protein [Vibrio]CAH6793994.1 putative lipopolysaccharide biosynthesis O-acetyl transferase WbbJ [Vibrio chagasii]NOI95767.1 acetyltransferase [Vibrio sp. T3Y01]NVN82646.1 acetyltransferase [Vibrio sp. Scap16]PQJ57795.1 acetyltransferase [Vibrio splendidus]QLE93182.1 acetyltransferase [Vibrio sp. Scap24]